MSVEKLLDELDNEQRNAVTLETNGVVAAGAGSGKTKVLASRYAWLVMEKNLDPEEILTLTFTNKAVSEMYSRIYRYLLEQSVSESSDTGLEETRAVNALNDFHKARISTLDSFSAGIARTAAARYGISPDFTSDDSALRDLAREAALVFVLDNREAPAIRTLIVDHKIRKLAEEVFARFVLQYSPISNPLDLGGDLLAQKETILRLWREKTLLVEKICGKIVDALHAIAELNKSIGFTKSLGGILLNIPLPSPPDIEPLLKTGMAAANAGPDDDLPPAETRLQIKKYFEYYSALVAIRVPGNYSGVYTPLVEYFRQLKGKDGDGLYQELESIANYAFNFGLSAGIFSLVKKFQDEFDAKKRETGLLSFYDIARLAVDALKDHPDIRKVYKDSLKMIMIDEFQDNNALQRDLIYLLAENSSRADKGIPFPADLEENRMFFVGDEKQSIYRFRGADVAVFRSLSRTMDPRNLSGREKRGGIDLIHNYRSRPGLIAAFNHIFDKVFLAPGPETPDYEAAYSPIKPPENYCGINQGSWDSGPLVHFCFLNEEELPRGDAEGIRLQDLEAAFIAEKIRNMVYNKEKIFKKKGEEAEWTECTWGDFAILERAYTHQGALEKYLREFAVPYNTDRPSGLFNEAPILDLRAYLRLLVYPEDRIAYAALIRSPFTRLSDLSLSVCMLSRNPEPFSEENEALIPEEDLRLYRRARERYQALREASRRLPITELVTKLWFEEGYRYETLWTEQAQVYEGLFDLFFSLASDAAARGKSLAEFIEYLDDVMNREEKPDDKDIPGEGDSGVRILSIHKSKGLEFPVVFIYDCTHSGNTRYSPGLVNYHEKYGLILNIPQAEELPLGGNYFRRLLEKEEKAKDTAELRRLLYVAMTRAECRLFLTFTLPRQTKKEKEEWDAEKREFNGDAIRARLLQLCQKSEGSRDTFLKLLQGILPDCPASLCTLEIIPALTRDEISRRAVSAVPVKDKEKPAMSRREAALAAATFYEKAEVFPEGKAGPMYLEASKLVFTPEKQGNESGTDMEPDVISDKFPDMAGVNPADFGSLVHAALEGRLNQQPYFVPSVIRSRIEDEKTIEKLKAHAEAMTDSFLASDLGRRCIAAVHREPEFPVITSVTAGEKPIAIMGRMDLLFEEDDEVVVVDFKTDRIEKSEYYYGQLAAYYRAAGDIFGKRVSVWLYYLRSGRSLNVTEEVKCLSLEELAAALLPQ